MFLTFKPCFIPALLLVSTHAAAATHTLDVDYGVSGIYRYCRYMNSKVYTVPPEKACPPSVADRPEGNGKGNGILYAERNEGTTKLCVYNVNGVERTLRVDNNDNCQSNQVF